ncbi:MAG: hypothetical protein M1115_11805 [Actinobacteria bacterium]|nr:hypothetical protein [Actinomycetota bacterium]
MSFEDPAEDRTWMFEVTFLLSNWSCIFGCGCQGVLTGPAEELEQGCCSYGAHFTGVQDLERVEAAAQTLSPEQWQHYRKGAKGIAKRAPGGGWMTRQAGSGCIFLNHPGFPGGAGCALHRASLERGKSPITMKPDVCWQLPLRISDRDEPDGHVTTTVERWERRHWGEGGKEFHWWCTEDPEAFVGTVPAYVALEKELVTMTSSKVYELLSKYLEQRGRCGGAR